MKKIAHHSMFWIAIILTFALLAGCSPTVSDDSQESTSPQTTATDAPDTDDSDEETPYTTKTTTPSEETTVADVDFSDPEEVLEAFWQDYTAGNFDRAQQFVSSRVMDQYTNFRSVYEDNPYALQLWKLVVGGVSYSVSGRGSSGDEWVILNLDIEQKNFEELFSTPQGEEKIMMIMALLHLSGFDIGAEEGEMDDLDITFSDELWNETFGSLSEMAQDLPKEEANEQIELILEDGKWKVDEIPFTDLFN